MLKSESHIVAFFHCRNCIKAMPPGESPHTWSRLSTGWTPIGLQVWCDRCELNVVHLDFKGQKVEVVD